MEQRKLAAIMFADVVGYSRMMGEDEQETLRLLNDFETNVTPMIEQKGGAVLKKVGDNLFCEFSSALNAVDCSLQIQTFLEEYNKDRPENFKCLVRISIHVGDVVKKDNDLFGDGVNLTARIQPLAPPGGICISKDVLSAIRSHAKFEIVSLGKHKLKNIAEKQAVYQVFPSGQGPAETAGGLDAVSRLVRRLAYDRLMLVWITVILVLILLVVSVKLIYFQSETGTITTDAARETIVDESPAIEQQDPVLIALRSRADSMRIAAASSMQVARDLGAASKAARFFNTASERKLLGDKYVVAVSTDSLKQAIAAYAEAVDGFENARKTIFSQAKLEDRVSMVAEELRQVKEGIPGSRADKERDSNYQEAVAKDKAAQDARRAGNLSGALSLTGEAKELYENSRQTITATLRTAAMDKKATMVAAQNRIAPSGLSGQPELEKRFRQGQAAADAGDQAYMSFDYPLAADKFDEATSDFEYVAQQLEIVALKSNTAAADAIKGLREQFEQSVRDEDIGALKALFKNISDDDEQRWQTFFQYVSSPTAVIAEREIKVNDNTATVHLLAKFYYKDNRNRAQEDNYEYTWVLEQLNNKWLIAKFDQVKIN
jgi:class 3 adenylate cyclase